MKYTVTPLGSPLAVLFIVIPLLEASYVHMSIVCGANFPELTSGTPYAEYTIRIVSILSTAFHVHAC